LLQSAAPEEPVAAEEPAAAEDDGKLPGALEATEGVAPEITTHKEGEIGGGSDLSPEENAVHGLDASHADDGNKKGFEENGEIVELAEGRVNPPVQD
jgi:hypothetical protein